MSAVDPVALTRELVRFDTRNPPGHEAECARMLAEVLRGLGLKVEAHPFGDGRINIVARLPGTGGSEAGGPKTGGAGRPIAFTGHLDTVPLGKAGWSRDPFSGEIVGGRLYGRGACDMKAGVAAMVAAVAAEAEALAAGGGATLLITGGEETGSEGAAALAAAADLGGAALLVVGEPTGNALLAGHKGALWLKVVCHGRTAHGSMPHLGDNAVYKAMTAVAALRDLTLDAPPHAVLGAPTLNIGTIAGGENVNSVPDRVEIGVDIRTVPGLDHGTVAERVRKAVGPDCTVSIVIDLPPVWSDPERSAMRAIAERHRAVTGMDAPFGGASYFTDASVLTPALGDVDTVICGPGDAAMAHQTDEYCDVVRIREAVDIYRAMISATV